jgi:hypothetical protein
MNFNAATALGVVGSVAAVQAASSVFGDDAPVTERRWTDGAARYDFHGTADGSPSHEDVWGAGVLASLGLGIVTAASSLAVRKPAATVVAGAGAGLALGAGINTLLGTLDASPTTVVEKPGPFFR